MLDHYLVLWNLVQDGKPITTPSSHLLPVLHGTVPAMLKVTSDAEEKAGSALMEWWDGHGAARVFCRDHTACLIERATGAKSLSGMARSGQDDAACRVLCSVAERLHTSRMTAPPDLAPLESWFSALGAAAVAHGGMLVRCAETARALLAEPCEQTVLHGDVHHGNVLDFRTRGWLAIDPKGVLGERGFDFANIFLNPDLADWQISVATDRAVFQRRIEIVTSEASLSRDRLLRWILAWSGLSAAWLLNDGVGAPVNRQIAEMTAAELDR